MLYEQEISLVRLSDGDSGRSSFVHIKYSNDGKTFTTNNGEDIGSWLGIYTDDKEEESTVFSDYKWSKILGATGAVGTGIDSVTKEFYLSDSKTTQSGSSWQTKMPEWSYGKYLWTREKIVYKNPTSTVYTTPSCDSSWEAANVVDKKVATLQTDFKVEQGKIESLIKETSVIKETYTTKDEFNSLQIGGRNLLPITDFNGISKKYIVPNDTVLGKGGEGGFIFKPVLQIKSEIEYTISLNLRGNANINFYQICANSNNTSTRFVNKTELSESEYKRFTLTFIVKKEHSLTEVYICTAWGLSVAGDWFEIEPRSLKLELGNKATDWTPAPEDLEQKVTTLTDKYNQTVKTVEGNKTTIANVKTSVDEVSGKVTKMESSITEIKQTADGVKTTVTANKDKWDKASSDASNAVSTANKANGNASQALNKATTLETKANNGEFNGRGVKSAKVEYQASTSGTTAPSGTWSPTVPTVANGSYLWTRTTITYTSGDPSVGYSVARMGVNGAKGDKGASGKDGVSPTVTSTKVEYQQSTNGTTAPTGTWSTTAPTANAGQYMWTKTTVTYSDGKTAISYTVSKNGINGAKGDKGLDGKSPTVSVSKSGATTTITVVNADGSKTTQTVNDGTNGTPGKDGATGKTSYFHVKYSNDGGKTFTANHGETVGDYLGTYTDFVEADSNSVAVYTWVKIKGNTGATGAKGETGSDGKGISSIVHHYLVTNVTTGVTSSTSGWKNTPQSVTSTNKYLWYYQTINYTSGTPTNTTPAIIGVYGDTGNKGATGKGISSVTPQYYLSTSNTTQAGGSWKTTQDTWSSGKYYWTRDSIAWSDGTTTTTTPTLATGLNNANSTANNAQTIANQTASKFQWIVKSGTSATDFTLTDRTAQLVANNINLNGLVTFKGLSSDAQNKIINAESNASTALSTAKTANSTASTASGNASSALEKANSASNNATSALTKASNAENNASNALSKANSATSTANTANSTANRANTTANVAVNLARSTVGSLANGRLLYKDVKFDQGANRIEVYNNADGNMVTIRRQTKSSDNPCGSYELLITNTGASSPGCGGFKWSNYSRANAVFVYRIIAKIPTGRSICWASNSFGSGAIAQWLTSNSGTGKFTEYVLKASCGATGNFSTIGYFYIDGSVGTTDNPVTWNVAYAGCWDMTDYEDKANQSIIDNWAKDSVVNGETVINGGYIKTNTIKTDQLAVDDIFATGSAAMNIINAQEINANRITSGLLSAERINAYGLSILNKTTNQQTFNISNNGEVTIRGSVSSGNYVEGKTGWAINNDGTAEFNDIIARGSVITNDGGIVSSGGTGKNLLLNSNFSKSYTGNSFTVNNITYNTYAKGYGGYNGGINNPKTNYHAYLDTKTNHIVFDETNGSRNWKGIVPDGDTFPALVGKNITSLTLSMQTKASDSGTYVFGGFYYIKKGGTIRDFHAGQFEKFPPKGETRISTAIELGSDVDWSKGVDLYIYGYNFSTNSKLEIWDLKLEEGTVATPWSPAPEDKLKQVRFWAGGSYDERESAPWIVYSDGSMKATQGEFSGVFSGTVDIGNIKIADPSSTAGNDALLTIQNGSNGIKRVQLTDNASSSFAQDIIVTNNTYSTVISLKQDGSAYFSRGINIADKTTLNSSSLIINNNTLTTTPNGSGFLFSNNLDIGTANKSASLNIHGDISTDNITIDNTLYFGNVLKFTKNANGINIDFI